MPWRRAAQPLRSNLFRSFPPSRYRSVAERVMDVGASFLRENVGNTRSAVKVECLRCRTLYTPLPPPSCSRPFWIQFSIKLVVDAACPFELVMRARDVMPEKGE